MILQSLVAYYNRMQTEQLKDVPRPGYAETLVSKCIVLDLEGNVILVHDLTQEQEILNKSGKKEKKRLPRRMLTPQQPKRSGRRPEPAFLCENTSFIFGIYNDKAGSEYRFTASRDLHEQILRDVCDPGARAVLAFFSKRKLGLLDYGEVDTSSLLDSGNIIFQLENESAYGYIHERRAIQTAWEAHLRAKTNTSSIGQCLVTGEVGPIARIHGNLEGFGQDKPTLVGFNQNSFASFGKEKGDNAPVSEAAAFKYVTAMNMLIVDKEHCLNIHGDKLLFWAERTAPLEENAVSILMQGATFTTEPESDVEATRKVKSVAKHLLDGTRPEELGLDVDVRIFVLGISTNKTRLVIRYFYENTFGQLVDRLQRHHRDIYIEGPAWEPEHPSFRKIMLETSIRRESWNVAPPQQVALIRSVMNGTPYPNSVFLAMLTRIRAEAAVDAAAAINRTRIGFIKGYLNRINDQNNKRERIGVKLNEGETSVAYRLGCIFAILNKAQSDAIEKVNASIVDKYLNAALASPEQVFPSLLAHSEHHFSKSKKFYAKKLLLDVAELLPKEGFPKTLNAEGQGQFMIGFYHQQQVFFKGKDKTNKDELPNDASATIDEIE
ncbi:type I-C CRISPR-associated protein Cas8c/Csd1 [Cohnella sp. CIP 111063]|uniref:type I-C CRISPR-associated protein Cas8c/Csd1 n=1 Tax=unclassified Cohnella TaxID=2636738 RepID=UPI000B8C2B04|nr:MULTISPECIES: type I-C CRISPR-associated protein Cas8c/Csd1 [unclassified Cohnella]OXS54195.1 type I-C CRISPR-associated protein Cas8c/Csd1 [Cohnella sp. CIP 111063]PRX63379.1 CRISPR-associated protein Csd1 [Cohnella sp. SGD-V74]